MKEDMPVTNRSIAVVIPCFRVRDSIDAVLEEIDATADLIYIVDDACPQFTGKHVLKHWHDPRIKVIFNKKNYGVGGATMIGYRAALQDRAEVMVKLDGDGQMNPALISRFVAPILNGSADYTKGNRFFSVEDVYAMPPVRLLGNVALSFITKLSSGYWHLFDPTNGYTAISATVAARLPFDKISRRYFFESDLLFRLNTLRAVVIDIPIIARYEDEVSNLSVARELPKFFIKNLRNTGKRLIYNYFLRNFSFASIELLLGTFLSVFSLIFGSIKWFRHYQEASYASAGTVMLAALPAIIGVQMLLGFINHDISTVPTVPLQGRLGEDAPSDVQEEKIDAVSCRE